MNIFISWKKGAASVLLGLSLLGLGGCATTGSYAENNIGYEKCFNVRGEYKLVERDNDVYLEKIDGSESRQITHTPQIAEADGNFSSNGKYILFIEKKKIEGVWRGEYYKTNYDSDDSTKKQIDLGEYNSLQLQNNFLRLNQEEDQD